jgi:hypothetical protein
MPASFWSNTPLASLLLSILAMQRLQQSTGASQYFRPPAKPERSLTSGDESKQVLCSPRNFRHASSGPGRDRNPLGSTRIDPSFKKVRGLDRSAS